MQFIDDCLDWVEEHKKQSAMPATVRRNNTMKSRRLLKLVLFSGIISLSGCSSVMSHTGGKEGTYPGTRSSAQTLGDSDTNWGVKSLVALDMPFTAVMDTLLLPWDMFRTDSSIKSRVEKSEKATLATNSVIPPAPMPAQ